MSKRTLSLNEVKEIINQYDPVNLIAIGAPLDEYAPEIQAIYSFLIQHNTFDTYFIENSLKKYLLTTLMKRP